GETKSSPAPAAEWALKERLPGSLADPGTSCQISIAGILCLLLVAHASGCRVPTRRDAILRCAVPRAPRRVSELVVGQTSACGRPPWPAFARRFREARGRPGGPAAGSRRPCPRPSAGVPPLS